MRVIFFHAFPIWDMGEEWAVDYWGFYIRKSTRGGNPDLFSRLTVGVPVALITLGYGIYLGQDKGGGSVFYSKNSDTNTFVKYGNGLAHLVMLL